MRPQWRPPLVAQNAALWARRARAPAPPPAGRRKKTQPPGLERRGRIRPGRGLNRYATNASGIFCAGLSGRGAVRPGGARRAARRRGIKAQKKRPPGLEPVALITKARHLNHSPTPACGVIGGRSSLFLPRFCGRGGPGFFPAMGAPGAVRAPSRGAFRAGACRAARGSLFERCAERRAAPRAAFIGPNPCFFAKKVEKTIKINV